ncbi:hypothetical protein K439DRAFT_1635972 [Ramaria rubella]|nr:hypothetical protein K439DRAFT_1635972 [Ramaria rubella]
MRVRLDNIDHTLARPGPLDESTLPKVPVIRIYGRTSTGWRACLHIHQVYPYFFVDYCGSLNPDRVKAYTQKLTSSLNHALALSLHRDPHGSNARYIRAIILVKGIPFYGFHTVYQPFLKILVADPTFVSRTVTIMQSGGVMRTKFTTYENHLSYHLQFMCDFGLYGCGWVDLGDVFLREADEDRQDINIVDPETLALPRSPSPYFKQSRLPIELDVCSHQIQNRHGIEPRDIHSSLRIPGPLLPPEPLVQSVRELWEDERRRRIINGLSPSPNMPKPLSDYKRSKGGEWVDSQRLQGILLDKCNQEKDEGKVYHERNKAWERWVMSTFESIEALWNAERRSWKPKEQEVGSDKTNPIASGNWSVMTAGEERHDAAVDIDENMLSSQELCNLVENEEGQAGLRDREDEEDEDERNIGEYDPPNFNPDVPEEMQADPFISHADSFSMINNAKDGALSPNTNSLLKGNLYATDAERDSSLLIQNIITQPDLLRVSEIRTQKMISQRDPVEAQLKSPFLTTNFSTLTRSVETEDEPPTKRYKIDMRWTNSNSSSKSGISHTDTSQGPSNHSPVNPSMRGFMYTPSPPSPAALLSSMPVHGIPYMEYRDPYYSATNDLPERPREYAGLFFDLTHGHGSIHLPPWAAEDSNMMKVEPLEPDGVTGWEYAGSPPSRKKVDKWLIHNVQCGMNHGEGTRKMNRKTHIDGQTQSNIYGFKSTPNSHVNSTRESQNMTILALEVLASVSEGHKVPSPDEDEIVAVFYSLHDERKVEDSTTAGYKTGIVAVESERFDARMIRNILNVKIMSNELDLINSIIDIVLDFDPDILAGWEVQAASWGYLEARGRTFGLDVSDAICRAPVRQFGGGSDQWGMRHTSTFKVVGRHVLNVWRVMRAELSLNMYTFENVAFELLHRRVPKYSHATLTEWLNSAIPAKKANVFRYLLIRTCMLLEMLDAGEVITKTAEFARVFGVDFFSVISRGSQFKVESFMFRIAKPESFVLISPSKADVGKQNAAECMPLIMEPYSAFYKGPVVVLDFQSLYPSVMIAYNYCYSTCLGRIQNFKEKNKFGITNLENPPGLLSAVQELLTISPNGMLFVKPEVRRGLLGRMLTELLDTRVMVKQAMKGAHGDKALIRVLEARQLSLKYIANVTYGYTSATFSGRMPAVEIADAIVQSGRETLEKAIELVESTDKWGAKVVYGDTDSMFIYLQGRTKEQAFLIGNEIADEITAQNPAPIKLKFEKVYLPCVLISKKHYVGFKYERPDDQEPTFDAKGIETVRRDGVPAQQKMVERCLKILFRSQDLSAIKEFCQMSWKRILKGSVSMQDFIFAKEVKLGTYSDKLPPPPGAAVAARRLLQDANDEPQYGERVPYVISRGEPGMRLVDRAVSPEDLLNSNKHIDAEYYISRVLIPPLERIFNLMGADVRSWYDVMVKGALVDNPEAVLASPSKAATEEDLDGEMVVDEERAFIDSHYRGNQCVLCGTNTDEVICWPCRRNPQESLHALQGRMAEAEYRLTATQSICASCALVPPAQHIKCESLDCPWLYARNKAEEDIAVLQGIPELTRSIERLSLLEANQARELLSGEYSDNSHSHSDPDCDISIISV